jgi:hypothetical protein
MRRPARVLAAALMLAVGVGILALATTENTAGNRDFVCYWATGQQLAHHANPYDGPEVLRIERGAGFTDKRPFFMYNLPSAFFIVLPLGLVSERVGAIVWSLALVTALMASIRMLWIMQGRPSGRLHLIGYLFPPSLACMLAGQLGIFMLFGIVLFLYFRSSAPYLAGAALVLCALKPHLFLPFSVVLLAWLVTSKSYRILAGAFIALAAATTLSFYSDPRAWSQYLHMMQAESLRDIWMPTLSELLRLLIDRQAAWLQFVPALLGCAWALRYFWTNRERWDWAEHGSLLLLASAMVAPRAWFSDEVILLPAILFGLYRVSDAGRSLVPFGCIAGLALLEVLGGAALSSPWYLWTTPAWLLWYLTLPSEAVTVSARPDARPEVCGIAQ